MLKYGSFNIGTEVVTDSNLKGKIIDIFPAGMVLVKHKENTKWYYLDELKLN